MKINFISSFCLLLLVISVLIFQFTINGRPKISLQQNILMDNSSELYNFRFSEVPEFIGSVTNNQTKIREFFQLDHILHDIRIGNSYDYETIRNTTTINFLNNGFEGISTDGLFSVENITAVHNYDIIEYESTNYTWLDSSTNLWQTVATSFEVTEEMVNITALRLSYLKFDSGSLSGEAYISGISGGFPNNTKLGNQVVDLTLGGGTNTTLSIPKPVTLPAGIYAVILNETSPEDDENIFRFKYVRDDVLGDSSNESLMWQKSWGGSYATVSRDLFFSYEYIPVNPQNISQVRSYTNPQEVQLKYNNSELLVFSNNSLLLNTEMAEFTANSSITFNLHYKINYESLDAAIQLSTTVIVSNGTEPIWNNRFSLNAIPTGSYEINNRTVKIDFLPEDWAKTTIERNGLEYAFFSYNSGSTELIIYLGKDIDSSSWVIQFSSPNYIMKIDLKKNGVNLHFPYQIYIADILSVNAHLSTDSYNGKNASLQIFDYDTTLVYSENNVDVINNDISFTDWEISTSLNQTDEYRFYYLVVKWLSTNQSQMGYLGVTLAIINPSYSTTIDGPSPKTTDSHTTTPGFHVTILIGISLGTFLVRMKEKRGKKQD